MIDKYGDPMVVALDANLSLDVVGIQRLLELAAPPALEALAPLAGRDAPPVSVHVALPESQPVWGEGCEGDFCGAFGERLTEAIVPASITAISRGHAGGFIGMERALADISLGKFELCLVGGVDTYVSSSTLEWLDGIDELHSRGTNYGICPGEGAGFCLLASHGAVARLGLRSSTSLLAAASAFESNRTQTGKVCVGEGLSRAFAATLAQLPRAAQVGQVICDLNGQPCRGDEFGFAALRNSVSFAENSSFETPADCWGDLGAASGPLFAALAAGKRYSLGPLALLWASSEGGTRGAALLQTAQ